MGLAPYYEKSALAASHLLREFDPETFRRTLEARRVGVAFDSEAVHSPEGKATLELAVNLLSRLYPRLSLTTLQPGAVGEARNLESLARAVNPNIDIDGDPGDDSIRLVVGATRVEGRGAIFYLGSDGWVTKLSSDSPVGSGNSGNPFGAGAAACFGAANVFRAVFADQLGHSTLDADLCVSILDLDRRGESLPNPVIDTVDIGESHLVGVGAIGNATVWALARAPFLRGTLHLVDHEEVDVTNPQRYVLTTPADEGALKVTLAERHLEGSGLRAHAHAKKWGRYLQERADWSLERVAVALDTPEDRCAVQAALPRWIVNAWTQPEDLGVSRHGFLGGQACLACLYMPAGTVPDLDDQIVGALNLSEDALRDVRRLLVTGEPVGPERIGRIAAANGVPAESLLPYRDLPIRAFYQRAVCGGIMLALGAGRQQPSRNAEVPMAFQSALAGILLAAELVAHAAGLKVPPPPVTTKVNLLRSVGTELSRPAPKHPSGKCLCQDDDYIAAYRRKYGPDLP